MSFFYIMEYCFHVDDDSTDTWLVGWSYDHLAVLVYLRLYIYYSGNTAAIVEVECDCIEDFLYHLKKKNLFDNREVTIDELDKHFINLDVFNNKYIANLNDEIHENIDILSICNILDGYKNNLRSLTKLLTLFKLSDESLEFLANAIKLLTYYLTNEEIWNNSPISNCKLFNFNILFSLTLEFDGVDVSDDELEDEDFKEQIIYIHEDERRTLCKRKK